jgi:hypothetical protein
VRNDAENALFSSNPREIKVVTLKITGSARVFRSADWQSAVSPTVSRQRDRSSALVLLHLSPFGRKQNPGQLNTRFSISKTARNHRAHIGRNVFACLDSEIRALNSTFIRLLFSTRANPPPSFTACQMKFSKK